MIIDQDWAHKNCKYQHKIILPEGITEIKDRAFSDLVALEELIMPDSVEKLEDGVFTRCVSLRTIRFSKNLKVIPDYTCFMCRNLLKAEIPSGVNRIGVSAFSDCTKLKTVNIPDSVNDIKQYAFYRCTDLNKISILDKNQLKLENTCILNKSNDIIQLSLKDIEPEGIISFLIDPSFRNFINIIDDFAKLTLAISFQNQNESYKEYIKENIRSYLVQNTIKHNDYYSLLYFTQNNLIKKEEVDELIRFANKTDNHQAFVILVKYKESIGGFSNNDCLFLL